MEDPLPPGQVSLMKEKFSGVGGETLKYVPKDDWDPRKSTEERLGWSNHKLHPLSTREQVVGRDAVGLPKWVRLEKQVCMIKSTVVPCLTWRGFILEYHVNQNHVIQVTR